MEFEIIVEVIAEHLDKDASEITRESTLEELNIDSLDMVEITMTLEEKLDVALDNISGVKTVGDVADFVAAQKG